MVSQDDGNERSMKRFLFVAIGLGLGVQVPGFFDPAWKGLGLFVMWTPILAVLVAGRQARQSLGRMIGRPLPWGMMLLATFLGWFHSVVSAAIGLATGAVTWNTEKFVVAESFLVSKADFLFFFPDTGGVLPLFILHFVVQGLVLTILYGLMFAIGEEAGWRGYLQPALECRFGLFKGTLFVGIIWASWHLGFRLLDFNSRGVPAVLNALVMFPAEVIVVAFLYAWLVRRTGSVWPAVCAHAANNTLPEGSMLTEISWWGMKAASSATTVLMAILLFLLFRYYDSPNERYQSILVDSRQDPGV